MLSIPVIELRRQFAEIRTEILVAIERVCASQQFVLGDEVEALEAQISALTGAQDAVGCASGTDALWLALAAAGIRAGDRVITSPLSFFASASSIVRVGAEPVFADIDPETLNLNPASVRAELERNAGIEIAAHGVRAGLPALNGNDTENRSSGTKRARGNVKAIIPVHLYGQCANMDKFQEIAAEHRVMLIEDAAQAIGGKWRDQPAGSIGICAAFSFYPTKNLSAYGDAGMVTTQSAAMGDHMRRLRNHGSPERYFHTEFGWNARMDAIQAAVLRVKLKYLDRWNHQRRQRAQAYDRLLEQAGLVSRTSPGPVELLRTSPESHHVVHQYVIRVKNRDELRRFLFELGIGTEVYYPVPLHLQPAFSYLKYKDGDLPESERAAKEVLALPMFPELTADEQRQVVAAIAQFYS